MKHLIDMAADRAPYICQSQSLNLWLEDPEYKTLTSMHFLCLGKRLENRHLLFASKSKTSSTAIYHKTTYNYTSR